MGDKIDFAVLLNVNHSVVLMSREDRNSKFLEERAQRFNYAADGMNLRCLGKPTTGTVENMKRLKALRSDAVDIFMKRAGVNRGGAVH